jgi:hypothetical protein
LPSVLPTLIPTAVPTTSPSSRTCPGEKGVFRTMTIPLVSDVSNVLN